MDVQSAAPATGAITGTTPGTTGETGQVAGVVAPAQQPQQSGGAQPSEGDATLASVIAKLYTPNSGSSSSSSGSGSNSESGGGSLQPPPHLSVSYQVIPQLDLIVTVFSNPQTGQEVTQIPPDVLIGLAEFFDHTDGVTIDQKV
jgi:hypothetical protein